MKVYVVFKEYEEGGCSWPRAVFSSYEKAEAYIETQPEGPWEIDSYEVDDRVPD